MPWDHHRFGPSFRVPPPPFQPTTSPSSPLQNLAPVCKSLRWRSACSAKHTLEAASLRQPPFVGQGVCRRESNAPRAHGRSIGLQRLIVNPTPSEKRLGVRSSVRQTKSTDLCLDVPAVRSFFLFFFLPSFLPPPSRAGSNQDDRGQNDSRWAFYESLALERRAINLKQLGGI